MSNPIDFTKYTDFDRDDFCDGENDNQMFNEFVGHKMPVMDTILVMLRLQK
jgi:hypothetical protein